MKSNSRNDLSLLLKSITAFWLALILFLSTASANICQDLFTSVRQSRSIPTDQLSSAETFKQLAEQGQFLGYSLKNENSNPLQRTLYKTVNGEVLRIGLLTLKTADHLFEWKNETAHNKWIENGQINSTEMNQIVQDTSPYFQVGKGFYVSLNPHDSESYGTHLTVIKNPRPLILLQPERARYTQTEDQINEYRRMGISGAMNHMTWLTIFNETHLTSMQKFDVATYQKIRKAADLKMVIGFINKPSIRTETVYSSELLTAALQKMKNKETVPPMMIETLAASLVLKPYDFLMQLRANTDSLDLLKMIVAEMTLPEIYLTVNFIENSLSEQSQVLFAPYTQEFRRALN